MASRAFFSSAILLSIAVANPGLAAPPVPVLVDTDIGSDIDDAFALALALASPELDVRGITTVGRGAQDRAWMVCRLLTHLERGDIPVAFGRAPQPDYGVNWQIQYRRHPAVVWNRTVKPAKDSAVEFLYKRLKAAPRELSILAVGPLTNIARLLEKHPETKSWIKRIVLMGGSVRIGYDGKGGPDAEWNIKSDVKAARVVFQSRVPLVVAPLDATGALKLGGERRQTIFAACTPLTYQMQALYQLCDRETPTLFDPAAVALAFTERFFEMEDLHLAVDDDGHTRIGKGNPNARVATFVRGREFLDWFTERVAAFGDRNLPHPPKNVSSLVARGGLPRHRAFPHGHPSRRPSDILSSLRLSPRLSPRESMRRRPPSVHAASSPHHAGIRPAISLQRAQGDRRGSLRGAASRLRRKVPRHLRTVAPEDQRSPRSFHSLRRSAFRLSSVAVL